MPVVDGIIERRLLVNYRVAADALAGILPPPFRPKLVRGYAIAGICLIRLAGLRPRGLPGRRGLRSENAAHRIAVEWDVDGQTHQGVYIPRRDSDSRLNTMVGGRLFPGLHHRAVFATTESQDRFDVGLRSVDGCTRVAVVAHTASSLPTTSIFSSLQEASDFFRGGSIGYSATRRVGRYDGLALHVADWHVAPLHVERVTSSFFENAEQFASDAATFDCALVMRGIAHSWHALPSLSSVAANAHAA